MDKKLIDDIKIFPIDKIHVEGGDVYHGLKASEESFKSFGEAYFSFIESGAVKAWKKHRKMTLNLIVPLGRVEFAMFDDDFVACKSFILSPENYSRLTIPPNIWVGFKGLFNDTSMLLNIADIEHDPNEVERLEKDEISFNWSNK